MDTTGHYHTFIMTSTDKVAGTTQWKCSCGMTSTKFE